MAVSGGIAPYDKANALVGPARVLYAPTTVAVPADLWDIVPAVADVNGEYPAKTGWIDFGLAADAPSYSHDKDTEGLEFQQPSGTLFEQITEITRQFTAQIAEISPENMKIVENAPAAASVIAAAANESAQKKLPFGSYHAFTEYRIALVTARPTGSASVVEPAPSSRTRPPLVGLVLPRCVLAAEESEAEFDKEDPVNIEVTFTALPESTLTTGNEYGFWAFETPGTILAT